MTPKIEIDRILTSRANTTAYLLAAAILFVCVFLPAAVAQTDSPELIRAGASLFRGTTRFSNGGPACAACHSAASLPFPGGGTMGPDLTHEYSKVGLVGLQGSLQTLFFPTMTPLFGNRPLTTEEQGRVLAFLKDSDSRSAARRDPVLWFSTVAIFGCVLLLVATWMLGRKRVRSVRHALLKRTLQEKKRLS